MKMSCFSWKMVLEHEKASVATAKNAVPVADGGRLTLYLVLTTSSVIRVSSILCFLISARPPMCPTLCLGRKPKRKRGLLLFNYKQVGLLARI